MSVYLEGLFKKFHLIKVVILTNSITWGIKYDVKISPQFLFYRPKEVLMFEIFAIECDHIYRKSVIDIDC